jgi:DNA-binding NtrC family response regulator
MAEADDGLRESIKGVLLRHAYEVLEARDPLDVQRVVDCHNPALVIIGSPGDGGWHGLDLAHAIRRKTLTLPIILIPSESTEALAIAALRADVTDYFTRPLSLEEFVESVRRCLRTEDAPASPTTPGGAGAMEVGPCMVGETRAMQSVFASIARVASTDSTVLVTGETGTGKDLVAELIHHHSPRRHKPFVRINCAAIPDTLLESELFGYERGAFTGAQVAFDGKLKRAEGGTAFFDEIGEMSPYAQAKLLRVIETREADRLGAQKSVPLNIRVSAATNQELEPLLSEGKFRRDLFFRLNVVRIHLPALRERRQDIPPLVEHYVKHLSVRLGVRITGVSASAVEALIHYDWPGNVRELKNVLEAVMVGHPFGTITPACLPAYLRQRAAKADDGAGSTPDSSERDRVLTALFETKWNKCRAAKQLRWSRMTLYRKMAKYHITSA